MINLDDLLLTPNLLLIGLSELKPFFLSKKLSKPSLNFKFININDCLKHLYGEFNNEAIKLGLTKFNLNYDEVKKYLEYISLGVNEEIDPILKKFKNELIKEDLVYIDKSYINLLQNRNIYFVGLDKNSNRVKNIINKANLTKYNFIDLNDLFINKDINVIKFNSLDKEIHYALNEIIKLIKDNKEISLSDILILTDIKSNKFYLEYFASLLNLKLDFNESISLYDTVLAKRIEKNIESLSISKLDEYDDKSEVFNLIKDALIYFDFDSLKDKPINYKEILKDIKYKSESISGIKVSENFNYYENKYIFIIGFDNTFYSKVKKNNDLFDDKIKVKFNLDSTDTINKEYNSLLTNFLNLNNNLNLYYADSVDEVSYYLNNKYKDSYKKHLIKPNLIKVEYSKEIALGYYSYYTYMYKVFKENNYSYYLYKNYFGELSSYDNSFKRFNVPKANKLKLSYTNINKMMSCPFSYYLTYILMVDEYEDNYALNRGKFIHSIFEKVYDDNVTFSDSYNNAFNFYKDKFSKKDLLFLDKYKVISNYVYNRLRKECKKIKDFKYQNELGIYLDIEEDIVLYGKIDSILMSKNYLEIIDYKTGFTNLDTKVFEYGLNMQLPIYSYLVNHKKGFSNYTLEGIFYLNLDPDELFDYDHLNETTLEDEFLKKGKISGDLKGFQEFEPGFGVDYTKSKTTFQVSLKKDGTFSRAENYVYKFDKTNDELVLKAINIFYRLYKNNDFRISPFCKMENESMEQRSYSCMYCKFNDICFTSSKDDRILKGLDDGI